jgi:hypothetical protein
MVATPPQSLDITGPSLIAERYRDNDDGTVTDLITGLQWKRCAEGQTWTGATCSGDASSHNCETACGLSSHFAGHSDWRLPTIDELKTLVYCSSGQPKMWNDSGELECQGIYNSPTIQTEAFPNTPRSSFWSSSPYIGRTYVWDVGFRSGFGSQLSVMIIREPQRFIEPVPPANPHLVRFENELEAKQELD